MNRSRFYISALVSFILIAGCGGPRGNSARVIPEIHTPAGTLSLHTLQPYTLAYCWRSLERDAFGDGRTDIMLARGDGSRPVTIVYPITPPQATVSLGCFGKEETLRIGGYGLAWRPKHNQLTMVMAMSGPPGDHFYFVEVENNLTIKLPEIELWEHEDYFYHPNTLSWSPDGISLTTVGIDKDNSSWQNIWLYKPDTNLGERVTGVSGGPSYVSDASWLLDGAYLAVGYGFSRSGIEIVRSDTFSSTEISNENQRLVRSWPYNLSGPFGIKLKFSAEDWLQIHLYSSSQPAWIDQGQRVLFAAPASRQRVALFVVNRDGTDLHELLPELPGLAGLPKLSPDSSRLAFVRYPGWKERGRAEIAVVDLSTNNVLSLVVLPKPSNGDELYISGLDWTPDGKYLAFSSNHEGQSDIYVISADGQAWVNLTADKDGDAVDPIWRPNE